MSYQNALFTALISEFNTRKAKNPAYSLRAYARYLGVQPSGLSDVVNGKRKISRRMSEKLAGKIALPQLERIAQSRTKQFARPKTTKNYILIESSMFEVISRWYYFAIITLCELENFNGTAEEVEQRLGIPKKTASAAIDRLLKLGFVIRVDGKLRPSKSDLTTTNDIPSVAIQRSHQEHLELASSALSSSGVEERDFSFINIATDVTLLPEAKRMIKTFRRRLCAFLEDSPRKTSVVRLGVQIFPLTKGSRHA